MLNDSQFGSRNFGTKIVVVYLAIIMCSGAFIFMPMPTVNADPVNWWNTDWSYRKLLTIDHTKVAGDLQNFPIMVDFIDPDLASHAQSSGNDICFVLYSDNSTKLNHEIERYSGSSGGLLAWVNVTSLSSTVDTKIWMYYGSVAASDQSNQHGTWNNNYLAVYHMNGANVVGIVDSTKNHKDAISSRGNPTYQNTGKIDYCVYFDGVIDSILLPQIYTSEQQFSMQAWCYAETGARYVTSQTIITPSSQGVQFGYVTSSYTGFINGVQRGDGINTPVNQWHYMTFIQNATRNAIYSDTTRATNDGAVRTVTWPSVAMNISNRPAGAREFKGFIDEIRFSNVGWSRGWITTDYNTMSSPSTFLNRGNEENKPLVNQAPIFSGEQPLDNSENIAITYSPLSINIEDPQGNQFNWEIMTSPNVGSNSGTGASNGTKSCSITTPLAYSTLYTWTVKATDETHWTNKTYTFTTQAAPVNDPPVISDPDPANNSYNLSTDLSSISVTIQDPEGNHFNWIIKGQYVVTTSQTGDTNGTKTANLITPLPANTKILWYVNTTDPSGSNQWINATFSFTTKLVAHAWWNNNWMYRKQIIINHTLVQGQLTNFPVLISIPTDNDLKTHVLSNGYDLVFTDNNENKLNHEIEVYDSGTGQLAAWVNVSQLSSTNDTILYLYYGNSVAGNQQNKYGTWNNNYLMVHHMNDAGNIIDSTVNHFNGTNTGTTTDVGKIAGCRYFNSTSDQYNFGSNTALNPGMNSWTISFWTKITYTGTSEMFRKYGSSKGFFLELYNLNYFDVWDGTIHRYRYWNTQWKDDSWHLITMAINRGTNVIDLYLDGSLNNGFANGNIATLGSIESTASLLLRAGNNGRVDELRVETGVRDSNWIKTCYNNQVNPSVMYSFGNEEVQAPSNHPPLFSAVNPSNGSSNIEVLQTILNVNIVDSEGNLFNWTIQGHYVVSTGTTGDVSGMKSASLITPLPFDTEIVWYVNATDRYGSGNWTRAVHHFHTRARTLPVLKYSMSVPVGFSDVPALAVDINNDGQIEIIRKGPNGIIALNGATGAVVWHNPVTLYSYHGNMEIIDLNKDGVLDIIASEADAHPSAFFGNNGTRYWHNTQAYSSDKYLVAGDINADGYPEVFVCVHGYPGQIWALTHDGVIYATNTTGYPCWGGLTLGDPNGDGHFLLFQNDASGSSRGFKCWDPYTLQLKWRNYFGGAWSGESHCSTLVDVNNDGRLEVVVFDQYANYGHYVWDAYWQKYLGWGSGVAVLNCTTGQPISNPNGPSGKAWQGDITGMSIHSQPTVCDIDNDGHIEVITGGHPYGAKIAENYQEQKPTIFDLTTWSFENGGVLNQYGNLPIPCFEPPGVVDIDGDGNLEIIQHNDNNLTFYSNTYQRIGTLPLEHARQCDYETAQDVDGDGLLEIIFNVDGTVKVYDTPTTAPTPRTNSQSTFYSQHRGRWPYYTPFGPIAPLVSNENPMNKATNRTTNPLLSVHMYQYQQNLINIIFMTNASTGVWHQIGSYYNVPGGSDYSVTPTEMTSENTRYWWRVHAQDTLSGKWRNITYCFTTLYTSFEPWWNANWTCRKQIIIDHTKVYGQLNNFPVLISFAANNDLKTNVQPDGDDIVFTDVNNNKLNHEIEVYNSGTGQLVAWVNIPQLSSTIDTIIYLYYGNSVCGNQQNIHQTWNSNYLMVQHMNNPGNVIDSTANHFNGTNTGTTADIGQIASCRYFDSTSDQYNFGSNSALNPGMNSWTISFWTKIIYTGSAAILQKWGSSKGFFLELYNLNYFDVWDGNTHRYRYWNTQWKDGSWHLITMVINRGSNVIDLYLDGLLNNGFANGNIATLGSIDSTASLLLRAGNNGRVDELRIEKTVKNASWIKTCYYNQYTPSAFYYVAAQEIIIHNILISNENPSDGSMGIAVTPTLQATLFNTISYPVTWTIRSNVTGTWATVATGSLSTGNGTISGTYPSMDHYETTYYWSVNTTDGIIWNNVTYHFTTALGHPTISNLLPSDGAVYIGLIPTLQATLSDPQGDQVNWSIRSNASGSWINIVQGTLPIGAGTISGVSLSMNTCDTVYYWGANVTDGFYWTNQTFSFTTRPSFAGVVEDFEIGYSGGQRIGTYPGWYDGGTGPSVTSGIGLVGTMGLIAEDSIFTWTMHPFTWEATILQKVIVQMDFCTDQYGNFDNDRIGWMITDTNTDTENFFGVQLQPKNTGLNIEGYWDHVIGVDTDKRPSIVQFATLDGNSWYRFKAEITKLSASSAQIDVTLTGLDPSGYPMGVVASGSITDTSMLGTDSPDLDYFLGTIWPAFNNNQPADNANIEIIES